MKTAIQPLFKWTGSKQRMLAQYAPYFFPQDNFTRFVDLFEYSTVENHFLSRISGLPVCTVFTVLLHL